MSPTRSNTSKQRGKLLFVSFFSPLCSTGIEKTLRTVLPTLAGSHNISVCFYSNKKMADQDVSWFARNHICYKNFVLPKIYGLEFYIYIFISNMWALRFGQRYDVVVGNNISIFFYLLLRKLFKQKAVALTIYQNVKGSYYDAVSKTKALWQILLTSVDKYCATRSDRVIAVSNGVSEQLVSYYGTEKEDITVIYNAVASPNTYSTEGRGKRKKIVFISNDNRRKGIDVFMSLVDLYRDRSDVTFLLVGTDRSGVLERENLEQIGFVPNEKIDAVLKDAYLLLLPSRNEGHPFVALEALARGVPVVCSKLSNVEIIEATKAGQVVFSFNPVDYKIYIDSYLNDENYYTAACKEAYMLIKERYSLEKNKQMYINFFKRLLNK